MTTNPDHLIRIVGRFLIFMAAVFLLLFLANLRSRFYYSGPNYSFLFCMVSYCAVVGIGLLKLKKWAVLLLFLPGILAAVIFIYGWKKGAAVPLPGALLNYFFLAGFFAVPLFMLRKWRELTW